MLMQLARRSRWSPVSADSQTLSATANSAVVASVTVTPPSAPAAFTTFLLGSKEYGYSLVPSVDAPETGPCKPP
jgi:hypothetical protein